MIIQEIEIRYKKRDTTNGLISKPIREARQVVELFSDVQSESKEKMITICLDAKVKILCFEMFEAEALASVYSRPMEAFRTAFPVNAFAAMILQNRPSGDPMPSLDDEIFTEKLLRMSKNMGLIFYDHIIIGEGCYYSFAEHGKLGV